MNRYFMDATHLNHLQPCLFSTSWCNVRFPPFLQRWVLRIYSFTEEQSKKATSKALWKHIFHFIQRMPRALLGAKSTWPHFETHDISTQQKGPVCVRACVCVCVRVCVWVCVVVCVCVREGVIPPRPRGWAHKAPSARSSDGGSIAPNEEMRQRTGQGLLVFYEKN